MGRKKNEIANNWNLEPKFPKSKHPLLDDCIDDEGESLKGKPTKQILNITGPLNHSMCMSGFIYWLPTFCNNSSHFENKGQTRCVAGVTLSCNQADDCVVLTSFCTLGIK